MIFSIYKRPVLCFSVFACVCILLGFLCAGLKIGQSFEKRYLIYTIRFEYYGTDAREMEKTIIIPLEEKIAALSGLVELTSVCEYGKSYTTVYFVKNADEKNTYLALRDAVDTLYNTLPLAVQKPRIYSSSTEQKPVISIAVQPSQGSIDALRSDIEKDIKHKIEAIDGVSEVIIAGGHIEEIKVEFDTDRLAAGGINPAALAGVIQDSNSVYPNGVLKSASADTNVVFNTRLSSLDDIDRLPVIITEGVVTQLSYLASVEKKPRAQEEIVRINGKESVVIHVKSTSNGNSIAISKQCCAVIDRSSGLQMHYQIIDDDGEFIAVLIRNLCFSILQSFLLVLVIVPSFYKT
jgi:multidrug efflux pump subunit AcrB